MLTHETLMKYFGPALKKGYTTYQNKIADGKPAVQSKTFLRSICGFPGVFAYYEEGDDGESYIEIGYMRAFKYEERIATLTSYNHRTIFFKRFQSSKRIEKSTKIFNLFLPADFLISFSGGNYLVGDQFVPCRFNETSQLMFNSSNTLLMGTNLLPTAKKASTKKEYNDIVARQFVQVSGQAKLAGSLKLSMLQKKATALRSEIRPKYVNMFREILKQEANLTTFVNFLSILGYKFDPYTMPDIFEEAMRRERNYGLSILENN